MRRSIAVIFAVAAIAAFACGGGSSKQKTPVPTATAVSDAAFKAAAESAASSIHIKPADLPAGWTGKVHEKSNSQFDLSPECAQFNEHDSPNAVVDTDSDDFSDAADRGISSGVTVYRTSELAA